MRLHWSIYLIVGLIVTIVSSFMEGLGIFIVVGIVFMTIGMSKWLLSGLTKENDVNSSVSQRAKKANYVKCSTCKAWNYPNSKVCHYCNKPIR